MNRDDCPTNVLVIGAGPAGLTAAYLLTKAGMTARVIERDPRYVGGISRTESHKGYLFDIGGHRFFSKAKEVVDLWDEILPNDFIERPRLSRIFYDGKFYSYPLKAFEALNNLGYAESAYCILSFLYKQAFPYENPETFHQWISNQFGERLFSIFFKTYTEKVWGMSCDEISADWAAQRIKGLDLWGAMANALRRSVQPGGARSQAETGPIAKTLIESFRYPRKGPGMMWEAAARRIIERGGIIAMGHSLHRLAHPGGSAQWHIEARRQDGSRVSFTADAVISSAPIAQLCHALDPLPDCIKAADGLRYRDFLTVALMVQNSEVFPDNWIYIHEPSVKVGRIQNFRSWSPDMMPAANVSCLGLEYFCFAGDGLWSKSDDELIAMAKAELAVIGIAKGSKITDGCVVRQPKAYPVYDEGYRQRVDTIRTELAQRYPTLQLVGRNGMHKYNNQDHAMMTAMLACRNILAGECRYDLWRVNEDAEYHESGAAGATAGLGSLRRVPQPVGSVA
jgi:protoporphyrinogen oxidase